MKNFVFKFVSGDQQKFKSGEELFNLIATYGNDLFKDFGENKNLNILKLEQANKLLNNSDFYLEC